MLISIDFMHIYWKLMFISPLLSFSLIYFIPWLTSAFAEGVHWFNAVSMGNPSSISILVMPQLSILYFQ